MTRITKTGWPLVKDDPADLEPYMVDEAASGCVYICYSNDPKRIIRRITKNGTVTVIEFSYGRWEDRESLTYVGINDSLELE